MGYKFNPFTGTFDDSPSTLKGDSAFTTVYENSATWSSGVAQTLIARVFNAQGTPLNKGDVVYSYGAQGDTMSVKLASNSMELSSSKTFGFINSTIAPSTTGYATVYGQLEKLNLGGFTEGDALWLGSDPGTFTRIKPIAPSHTVYLGVVERANNGNGAIYIKVQNGYELNEIHDVLIQTVSAGDVIRRNDANNLWINTKDGAKWDSVYTTVSAASAGWNTMLPLAGGNLTGNLTVATSISAPALSGTFYGDVHLNGASILSNPTVNHNGQFLEININGTKRKIQLWD